VFFHYLAPAGILLILGLTATAIGQQTGQDKMEAASETSQGQEKSKYSDLPSALEKTIDLEKNRIVELKALVAELEHIEKGMISEINTYRLQISAHSNLFLLPEIQTNHLEEAYAQTQASLVSLGKKMKDVKDFAEDIEMLQLQLQENRLINERQSAELSDKKIDTPNKQEILRQYQTIGKMLSEEDKLLSRAHKIQQNVSDKYTQTLNDLEGLAQKLSQKIELNRKEELFKRISAPLRALSLKQFRDETVQLVEKIRYIGTTDFWNSQFIAIWASSGFYLVTFLMLFIIFTILMTRLCVFCASLIRHPVFEHYPVGRFAFELFQRSMPLFGVLLFTYSYSFTKALNAAASFFRMSFGILFIWLLTRWALDFFRLQKDEFLHKIRFRTLLLIKSARWFSIGYLIFDWLIGGGLIISLARIAFGIFLITWFARFWNTVQQDLGTFLSDNYPRLKWIHSVFKVSGYLIFSGGFFLDLSGYGTLAAHWSASWGKTGIILLWSVLILLVIQEFDKRTSMLTRTEIDGTSRIGSPVRWSLTRVFWLLWSLGSMAGVFLAWGARQAFFEGILGILNYKFHLGQIQFSILTFGYAFLIIVITLVAARFWRRIFTEKIMKRSGLEAGTKESIASISVYLVWAFGILISLHAFGLSTTSMAVAFGALGIGLGFGLQNIFSNFISGIILLFERPIQVGDAIEINGIWGDVRQINFRSTLVQTYDNATLIIPNSEFISAQVTNWSFKDKRVRRQIQVGVAYGSDTGLTKRTLLEVAAKTQRVLKYPAPTVLFSDFGDSALLFSLRFWTDVDHMLLTETDMRFEIDRLFRERGIEMAYPQQDLHIRSIDDSVRFEIRHLEGKPEKSGSTHAVKRSEILDPTANSDTLEQDA
jgi:small-conductance mechanosensitive channel